MLMKLGEIKKITGTTLPAPAKIFVTEMLTRDQFALAHFLVVIVHLQLTRFKPLIVLRF